MLEKSLLTPDLSRYFKYNAIGQLCVNHSENLAKSIPVASLLQQASFQGARYPMTVYFEHILINQLDRLYSSFSQAIAESEYTGKYNLAYPIKVNPEHKIVKAMCEYHQNNDVFVDYEVGTKSELLAVLSTAKKSQRIICNGFKDISFYRIAQIAAKIGLQVVMVIENIREIENIRQLVRQGINIKFKIGIRVKPFDNCIHTQKFGLSLADIVDCTNFLKSVGLENSLVLLHSHIGSQLKSMQKIITNIQRLIKIYSELRKNFSNLEYIDFGGGLAVNYDKNNTPDYDFDGYARTIVKACKKYSNQYNCSMPNIITESGRAMVAESSLFITKPLIKNYESNMENEIFHQQWLEDKVTLEDLESYLPKNQKTSQQAWLNFSLFQSLPDHWGIGQEFPILPLENYSASETSKVKLYDISCDIDGVIKSKNECVEIATNVLDSIAFMCVGAYQAMLSAKHNMLGNPNTVNIALKDEVTVDISVTKAENYCSLLQQYNYNSLKLQSNLRRYYYYHQDEMNSEEEDFLDNLFINDPYMEEPKYNKELDHANMAS